MSTEPPKNPLKIKTFDIEGDRLSPLKPRRARLLEDAGLAVRVRGEGGESFLRVYPAGVDFIQSRRSFDLLKRPKQEQPQAYMAAAVHQE